MNTITILPAGETIKGIDGRRFHIPSASKAALLAALNARDVVLDVNHSSVHAAPVGGDSPAAGWLSGFSFDATGALTARVSWTPYGQRERASKAYRFLSPALRLGANGTIIGMHSVALTNSPNFPGLSLNSAGSDIALCSAMPLRESWSGWTPAPAAPQKSAFQKKLAHVFGADALAKPAPNAALAKLTPAQAKLCKNLGISPEDFAKTKSGL